MAPILDLINTQYSNTKVNFSSKKHLLCLNPFVINFDGKVVEKTRIRSSLSMNRRYVPASRLVFERPITLRLLSNTFPLKSSWSQLIDRAAVSSPSLCLHRG